MKNTLICPQCSMEIDIDEVLIHQLKDEIKKDLNEKHTKKENEFKKKVSDFLSEKEKLEKEKEGLAETISKQVQEKVKDEKSKFEKSIIQKIEEEQSEVLKTLQEELKEKSNKLKEFNKAKAQIQQLEREKDELKDKVEADAEQKFTQKLKEEREKIKKTEEDKIELKIIEKNQLIEQLKENLKEAQRKAEQGSMQAQGEAQELAIEVYLQEQFPLDTIAEVKKGARGADCLQTINTRTNQNCGSIYYESKRTKSFSPAWIEKFRNDMRDKGANIGVLVTNSMPVDMDRMGQKEGVWICTLSEFKGLCFVLRDSIIQINNAIATQENKGEKMTMLYDFLTSNEFKLQIEGIVDGFSQMEVDLAKEKRSMEGHWKRREKQIKKVILNTNFMYNSIKGIAGNAIQTISALELNEPELDDFDDDDIDMSVLEGIDLGDDE